MSLFRLFPVILVLLCLTLTNSAPLPNPDVSLSTIERRDEYSLAERSLSDLADRDLDEDSIFERDVSSRSFVEEQTLVRRKSIAAKIRGAFKKAGSAIKKGFKKAGEGIKKAAKKVGQGVKTAAKKVGQFAKKTGAKIAKFGLQVVSTAQSVLSKAAKFIPGVGKPISAALTGASKVTGLASDKIHVSLGKKLDKGMKVMDKIKNPLGKGAGSAVLNALRRDIDEDMDIFERDDLADFDEGLFARSVDENLFARFPYEFDDQSVE